MKIVFMGTPDFAVPVLDALMENGQQVSLAVTQPDRARGRGRGVVKTPVKICAEKWNIPVYQPERVRTPEAVERLRRENADMFVVAAFGQILPKEVLDMPRLGCINVHASLLPKYRGAAPIQWAVINGEKESGVSIMQMDEGIDTGDILAQERVELAPKETGESLYEKLAALGGKLLVKTLPSIEDGTAPHIIQRDQKTEYARMLQREMGDIRWQEPAEALERLIRGLNSWPSAYTFLRGKSLKLWDADVCRELPEGVRGRADAGNPDNPPEPGMIIATERDHIYVMTGDGILKLNEVQLEGHRRMPVHDFLLGEPVQPGELLKRGAAEGASN